MSSQQDIPRALSPEELCLKIHPHTLGFETLQEWSRKGKPILPQKRAAKALKFGLGVTHPDFNIYIAGPKETGLLEMAIKYVTDVAKGNGKQPFDWCYVHNFKDPDAPLAVGLPKGMGKVFKKDVSDCLENLRLHIPKVFEGETYLTKKEEVIRAFNQDRNQIFEDLEKKVTEKGFTLQADQSGMMVIPNNPDGSLMTPEDIAKLSEEEQKRLKEISHELHKEMGAAMRKVHQLEQGVSERLRALDRELVGQTCDTLMADLFKKYGDHEVLSGYLSDFKEDVIKNMDDFRPKSSSHMPFPFPGMAPSFLQYEVNVIVDNEGTDGAPVIIESNPSYPNLFGAAEKRAQMGALFTDFTMIKAGALHKANGGFLILKAIDLLKWPFSYEALKRALRDKKLNIEDPGEQYGLFTTKTLKPAPIPLDIKIVLIGDSYLYQLLYNYDEEFRSLFKIKAHMETEMPLTLQEAEIADRKKVVKRLVIDENLGEFLGILSDIAKTDRLLPLHNTAVARLLEYGVELAGSQEKMTLKVLELADLLREADFWARQANAGQVLDIHVQQAIDEKIRRSCLVEDRIQELLIKDVLKVQTTGSVIGQVNGLAVYDLGDYTFGKPSRITANIALGKDGVVNIERESSMSGNIHTKGVMILAGYLRAQFARKRPLTLSATICFEQNYGMVDGDSASGAELFALLSALADVPIDQGKAVTGAVSQKGEILAIGGVNQKIEGFFDLCKQRGLTGTQGVLIPEANKKDLMLKQRVVDAVRDGMFHIWPISTVEEGLQLLTGLPAGRLEEDGRWTNGSMFARVDAKLEELAQAAKAFGSEKGEKQPENGQPAQS